MRPAIWRAYHVGPEGVRTEILRDDFGKPNSIERHDASDTVQLTRVYGYNTAQELCRVHEPETGSTYTGYDAAGNLKWSGSGFGPGSACATEAAVAARRSDRTYDNRNRLVDLRFADDTGEQVWTYTPDGLPATITTYNGVAPTYPYGNAYTYDKRRMLVGETGQDGGGFIWRIDNTYDRNGALASNVYPGAQTVDYAPNALGQATKAGTYATGVSYHPNGAIAQFTYGNGVLHVMTQNERLLPDRSRDYNGGIAILDDYYDYDANGNVVAITDGVAGNRGSRDMTYDDLDRLKSTTSAGWFGGTISYTYDVLDNIQSVTRPDSNQTYRYCYNTSWQLEFLRIGATTACNTGPAAYALTYDPQGNLYQKNAQRYVFTQDNRLRNVTGLEYYRYDGYGRRTLSWSPTLGSLTYVYGQDGTLRYMQDQRRGKTEQYVYLGGSLVAIREVAGSTTTIKYQHTDALGSPAAVTDAARGVVERSEREPYGKLLNRAMHDGPGFTGHAEDAATGLTYMQQRYYDPQIGAFLSVDPVAADTTSGWNFNRYSYAGNNPYKFRDPDGRIIDTILDVGFIIYDVVEIAQKGATATNLAALGADVAGALIPGATGLGAGVRAAAHAEEGAKIVLKAKEGWSAGQKAQAAQKAGELNKMAKEGKLSVTKNPERSATSASQRYQKAGGEVPKGSDVDHVQDLQLGGSDAVGNMQPLDSSVNRSFGAQIQQQIRDLPAGTKICGVDICQ